MIASFTTCMIDGILIALACYRLYLPPLQILSTSIHHHVQYLHGNVAKYNITWKLSGSTFSIF